MSEVNVLTEKEIESKFGSVLIRNLSKKAEVEKSAFFKEIEDLYRKYGMNHSCIANGVKDQFPDGNGYICHKKLTEHFVVRESERFMNQLRSMNHYFQDGV